ncbi:hypothetical protein CDL15_Pgr028127 [Punica granatum]|uniref:Uncharacterized protein n=1 Tax=Punica granatum TaxID=22663 RepID=A0A218WXC0_PUNGR|nr:hypothetical protein CDL15_Pgr028127 [Punica granatum]
MNSDFLLCRAVFCIPTQVMVWTIADIIVWNGEPKWGADNDVEAADSGACGGGTPECARGVPGDMGGGKCLNGAPEYAIGMPAIIGGGGGPYIVSV